MFTCGMCLMKRVAFVFCSFTEGRNGIDGNYHSSGLGMKEKMGKDKMDADTGMDLPIDVHEMKIGPKHSLGNFDR